MKYEGYGDHRGRTGHALVFLIFLLTVQRIRMFFSLKPSPYQGESSLKISARWGSPFRMSQGTSKHTDSLTDWCFDREIRDKSISTLHHRKKLSGGISHYKIARYIDGITSRDSNHLPHDSFRSSSANEKSVHLGIIKNLSIKFQTNVLSGFEVT